MEEKKQQEKQIYEKPEITDYGTLVDLTRPVITQTRTRRSVTTTRRSLRTVLPDGGSLAPLRTESVGAAIIWGSAGDHYASHRPGEEAHR